MWPLLIKDLKCKKRRRLYRAKTLKSDCFYTNVTKQSYETMTGKKNGKKSRKLIFRWNVFQVKKHCRSMNTLTEAESLTGSVQLVCSVKGKHAAWFPSASNLSNAVLTHSSLSCSCWSINNTVETIFILLHHSANIKWINCCLLRLSAGSTWNGRCSAAAHTHEHRRETKPSVSGIFTSF